MSTRFHLLIILCISNIYIKCNAFNLYKSSHPLRKSTRLFDRLKHHETILIKHNQFHHIDTGNIPIYPMNGKIEFHAFGHYYKLLIRKNVELFANNFSIVHHKYNTTTNTINNIIHTNNIHQCHYTAEVVSDNSGITDARFSACRGRGLQGWIHAFGETIVIRPKRLLTNANYKGKHMIIDEHIVYKYHELDRSDYEFDCGHNHIHTPDTEHSHTHNHITDLFHHFNTNNTFIGNKGRKLQSSLTTNNIRYVELAVVNDPGIIQEYGNNYDELTHKTIQSIATVQSFYFSTDWGTNIGTIQIVLSKVGFIDEFTTFGGLSLPSLSCVNGGNAPNLYQKEHSGPYCEIDYESYLESWHNFRKLAYSEYDNAHLLSYFDFLDSVIGYASISGMCAESTSGGIDQVTYDDEYNGNIIAHEMGHNFGMQHDSTGNICDSSTYIMAAKGSSSKRPNSFSSCSISYLQSFFSWNSAALSCLDNKPLSGNYPICRNGFVELGETCDCGQEDCTLYGDKCCDGSICGLFAFAECSNNDKCCSDCKIMDQGGICRELNIDELSCDIKEEICDGKSSQCPPDTFSLEGIKCGIDPYIGYCYHGICITIDNQCISRGHRATIDDECGYIPNWQIPENNCNQQLQCIGQLFDLEKDSRCQSIDIPLDGTPCNISSGARDLSAQCVANMCQYSSDIYTYKWTTFAWDICSISCKSNDNDIAGVQTRMVNCTLQDGSIVEDIFCIGNNIGDKPITNRPCNDYVCNFCSFANICGSNGKCDKKRGMCDCNSGYGGEFCDIEPSLNYIGITSVIYKDILSGDIIEKRANPCVNTNGSILAEYDPATSTKIIPIDGVSTINNLYIGNTINIRWKSTGDIKYLAVGMLAIDSITGEAINSEYSYPFYVGNSLAKNNNNEKCDNFDECYNDISCNDFTFTIPTNIEIGYYKLIIRFNNIYNIESDILTIDCSNNNCNSTGHGKCNDLGTQECICDAGWDGYSCEHSICDDWEFAKCNDCGSSIGSGDIKPKCFSSQCDYNYNIENITNNNGQCNINNNGCSNKHFEGLYCEIPIDYCSIFDNDIIECNNNNDFCEYIEHGNGKNKCVYSDCYSFITQEDCEGSINGTINHIHYDTTWNIFCKWDIELNYCNRITCGGNILPSCANGAVRKPLFASELSICNGWYCDCTTVNNIENSYWTVSDKLILLDYIFNNYSFETNKYPLTIDYINPNKLELFLCSQCGLNCQNGGKIFSKEEEGMCSNCSFLCPIEYKPYRSGIECNQVFWISSFRVKISYSYYNNLNNENKILFNNLLIFDLSYFLSTDIKHISIWQIKPDGSGMIIYFRYLFDTNNEYETQIIGGDIMILSQNEFTDDTSTATRGFIMKYIDNNYKFNYCVPNKEECDPNNSIDMTAILLICFFTSFFFESAIWCAYWFLYGKKKYEREYEEKVKEQKRILKEMMEENTNATRVGMRNVSKKRAKQIANDRAIKNELDNEKKSKTVFLDEALSLNNTNHKWSQHVPDNSSNFDDFHDIEMTNVENNDNDNSLPDGWQMLKTDDGEPYYFDTINQVTQWEKP